MDDDAGQGMDGYDVEDINEEFEELEEGLVDGEAETAAAESAKESRSTKFLALHHPECRVDYVEEVQTKLPLSSYPSVNSKDPNHKSVPYLTQYEKTKIIGFRSNQLSQGARPLIQVPTHVTDVMDIARLELEQKRLPFLLKRPMPDGTYEYWRLADLIIL
jgi:DNA-directed RNA polymerase I, II, and III subunit RPABC2